jgi:hypothetical protein
MAFGISGSDNIEIRIQVDNTGAVKVLGDTEKQIQKVGTASKDATNYLDEFSSGLLKGAAAAATAYLGFKGVQGVLNSINVGSQIDDVAVSFENLAEKAGYASNVLLRDLQAASSNTISNFDLMRKSNELLAAGLNAESFDEIVRAARSLSEVTGSDLKQSIDQVSQALITGRDRSLALIGVQVDNAKAAENFARSLGTTADKLNEAGILEANRIAILEALKQKQSELGDVTDDAADLVAQMSAKMQNYSDELDRAIATNPELNELLSNLSQIVRDLDLTVLINALSGLTSGIAGAINQLKVFNPLIDATATGLDFMATHVQGVFEAFGDVVGIAGDAATSVGLLDKAVKDNNQSLYSALDIQDKKTAAQKEDARVIAAMTKMYGTNTVATGGNSKAVKELAKSYELAESHVEKFRQAQERELATLREAQGEYEELMRDKAKAMTDAAPVLGSVFNDLGIDSNSLSQSIAGSLESALAEGINLALSGLGNSEDYRATATQLGGEIGTAIGGPVIGAFAEQLTNDIVNIGNSSRETFRGVASAMFGPVGGAIADGMFGSSFEDSAGTALKKSLDKILTDVGYDFTFSGNQDLTKGLFAGLGQQAQEQFTIAGDALTVFLGGSTDLGVNLGAVLANNNVHLSELAEIVESVGGSFESLANEMLMAFYEGELGVIALQDQLEELYGIMEGTSTFEDLGAAVQSALNADGRVLLNSIKAIGVEAQQLGAVTLPQMADILVNRFGIAASQVQIIMSSMTAAGINSVAQLAEATKLTSTAIAANIGMAQQGLTPNNTPVIPLATSTPKSGGGGSTRSSGGIDKAASEAKRKAEQQKQAFLRLLNQVQNSAAGRALEKSIAIGVITDGQYTDKIRDLTDSAKVAQKALDDAENKYAATRNKGAEKQKKALEDLLKAQKNLDTLLGVSTGNKSIDVNSGFISFAERFAGNIQLIEKAAEAAGLKFDDMREKALKAFLSGDKTFSEAKALLADSSKGVAGKSGAVGEVLSRLLSRGESGGIFSIDDLKGLASEAKELGATTLEGLFEGLSGQGASQTDQQALSIALQNAGVTALDQLENISTDVAINVLDIMKQSGAAFGTTSQELRDIAKQIGDIPTSKKVTIELDGSISPQLAAILERFNLMPEGLGQVSAGETYTDSSLGVKHRAEYKRLKKLGKFKKAENYKANHASYF